MAITYFEDGSKKKHGVQKTDIALNAGPSTPIKHYTDVNEPSGRFLINTGAGRIGNVRLKKGKV